MSEALQRQRVKYRTGQRRVLQRRLECLTLRPQCRIPRIGTRGSRGWRLPRFGLPSAPADARLAAGRFTDPAENLGDISPTNPAGKLTRVLVAQRGVLDLGDDRRALPQRAHPALGAVEVVAGQRGPDGELEQRGTAGNQVAQRRVTGGQSQIARVHPVGRHRDKALPGQVLLPRERLEGGRLPGRITVEHVDQFATKELVVHHQPAQHRQVLIAEGGAAGGDSGGHPGQMHGHHIGIALHHDGLMALGDIPLGQVDTE